MKAKTQRGRRVTIIANGRHHHGQWIVENGVVTVTSSYGAKAAEVGALAGREAYLAELLLRDVVAGWRP
jgi:hypothetical protein